MRAQTSQLQKGNGARTHGVSGSASTSTLLSIVTQAPFASQAGSTPATMFRQAFPCDGSEDECRVACTSACSEASVSSEDAPCICFWYFPPDVFAWGFAEMVSVLAHYPVASTMNAGVNLRVAIKREPLLSICHVANHGGDMESFGRLEHFCTLVRATRAPNIVVFCMISMSCWLISAKAGYSQQVGTKSALYWVRQGHGLGFVIGSACGWIYRIEASSIKNKNKTKMRAASHLGVCSLLADMAGAFPDMHFSGNA